VFACPECHGVLWEVQDGVLVRYRCRVGHAYLPQSLSAAHAERVEEALWVALRSLRENAALANRLSERARARNQARLADNYLERAQEASTRASLIEDVLRTGALQSERVTVQDLTPVAAISGSEDKPHE
jgi:two-component system, chemotaxis family, protein-glutamate methylesterase/glutaminase